jgi:hypothetical protein
MATAYLMEWPRIKQDQYETLVRALNWYGKILCGSAVHIPGPKGGSLIVMDVWESWEASAHFLTTLFAQALHKAGLPMPVMQAWEIPSQREPAPAVQSVNGQNEAPLPRQVAKGAVRMRLSSVGLN